MARNDFTLSNTTKARAVKFTACGGDLYQLQDTASVLDIKNQLNARLHQLTAMLSMVTGEDFEAFNCNADANKENFLWGCSMLAEECRELARYIDKATSDKPMQNAEESHAGAQAGMEALQAIEILGDRCGHHPDDGEGLPMREYWNYHDAAVEKMLQAAGIHSSYLSGFLATIAEYVILTNSCGGVPNLQVWKPEAAMSAEEKEISRKKFEMDVEGVSA